ncbi:MAG: transposase [Planctomycetota bacterium]
MDVHKLASQLCVIGDGGEVYESRIRTDRGCLTEEFGERARSRILIEASTESEWVARHLESLGQEVIVADRSFAPMYGTRSRRVKTDRRDARALAEALRLGAYRTEHRVCEEQRRVRAELAVREGLVRARPAGSAWFAPCCGAKGIECRRGAVLVSKGGRRRWSFRDGLAPRSHRCWPRCCHSTVRSTGPTRWSRGSWPRIQVVRRLTTVPGGGPITPAGFVAAIDDVKRFRGAHKVAAYVGVVPSEVSSGEKRLRGPITKCGNKRTRWLLVEAAWCGPRQRSSRSAELREWAECDRHDRCLGDLPVQVLGLRRHQDGAAGVDGNTVGAHDPARYGRSLCENEEARIRPWQGIRGVVHIDVVGMCDPHTDAPLQGQPSRVEDAVRVCRERATRDTLPVSRAQSHDASLQRTAISCNDPADRRCLERLGKNGLAVEALNSSARQLLRKMRRSLGGRHNSPLGNRARHGPSVYRAPLRARSGRGSPYPRIRIDG